MNGLFVILGLFSLIGVWMIVSPVGFITWFKSARPDLKGNPAIREMEDNPAAITFVKFLGAVFLSVTSVIFLAFAFAH